jgi:hypothetical protein
LSLGGESGSLAQQRVVQRLVHRAPALLLAQRSVQFYAVPDDDVADLAAFVQHDPGDAIQRALIVDRVAAPGRQAVRAQPRETRGVEQLAGFLQQDAGAVAQQPRIAGADDLTDDEYPRAGDQVGTRTWSQPAVRAGQVPGGQGDPVPASVVGAAGYPAAPPGATGLGGQPVQQHGQATPGTAPYFRAR